MAVSVSEHVWIPLSDGCRLGARLWLPEDAARAPVPAILEYIPYRKRDGTRGRDDPMHGYFAAHGYAAVRVDMRGSGESDGQLADEYLRQEQDDALEVIAWIARQPWCSGRVGMQGKSWGGFNALQVAARRPPALKAIITTFSTDNRYTDDIHYMGGCLLNDNLWWGSIMLAYQSRPLDPLDRRGELAGALARASRDAAVLSGAVARAPALRCLLEARLGLRGLRRDRVPGAGDRRLDGRLHQRGAAAAGRPQGAAPRHHRSLGPPLSARRRARTRHRLPPGGGALVGHVAQGPRHRDARGADVAGVSRGSGTPPTARAPSPPGAGWASAPGPLPTSSRCVCICTPVAASAKRTPPTPCSPSARRRAKARLRASGWASAVRANSRPTSGSMTAARSCSTARPSITRWRSSARRYCA